MATHSFKNLRQRLARAGFKRDFVTAALLPDWWDSACADDPALLPDMEFRVARFLDASVSDLRDPTAPLQSPLYAGAQLRRVRDLDRDRLAPALHAAMQIAAAAVRSLRPSVSPPRLPPADGLAWRALFSGFPIRFPALLDDLWRRGIPVVPIEVLPSPSFQGLACIVESRPVVLLAHKHDEPGRVAFLVAHEVAHLTAGDCRADAPVVDEQEEAEDHASMERSADLFATRLLVGGDSPPRIDAADFRKLAREAAHIERERGADAGVVAFAWARHSNDYSTAAMAMKALYRATGARRTLREHFDRWVDLEGATEIDRTLLRCVYGEPAPDADPD